MIKMEQVYKYGHFSKPHGAKGEVTLVPSFPDSAEQEFRYVICEMDGILVPFFVDEQRSKGRSSYLLKLSRIESPEDLSRLLGKSVYLLLEDKAPDTPIAFSSSSVLEGYLLSDVDEGEIGRVIEIDDSTMNVLLKIDRQGEELLIPIAEELLVDINHTDKTILMNLPSGLL